MSEETKVWALLMCVLALCVVAFTSVSITDRVIARDLVMKNCPALDAGQ